MGTTESLKETDQMKISIEDILAKVGELDAMLKDTGWSRDGRIDFRYYDSNYRVEMTVAEPDDEE
jgi:hypothetical protein